MKIISLIAENIKKLTAIEIKPDGSVVQITGKNGQGKTSVLDSIWWALAGMANVQGKPIRDGEHQARIRLDMGDVVVTRKFTDKGSTLTVENAEGVPFKSPQDMLNSLVGSLTFDPLAFTRMKPKEQFDELRKFVPGVDFEAIDAANKKDFDERTFINRQAKEEAAAATKLGTVRSAVAFIDTKPLVEQMAQASDHNSKIENRIMRRRQMADEIARNNTLAGQYREDLAIITGKLKDLEAKIATDVAKLEGADPLPQKIDVSLLQKQIADADASNADGGKARAAQVHRQKADELEKKAAALTAAIDKRNADKVAAISKVKLPVENITFGDGIVLLDNVPFNQGSDAQQLRASIAIAMAQNPKLRVIRVRDGSLLDSDAMKLLEQMAVDKDFQVWIERVEDSGKVGFVLEDGHIKGQVLPVAPVKTEIPQPSVKTKPKSKVHQAIDLEENGDITEHDVAQPLPNPVEDESQLSNYEDEPL